MKSQKKWNQKISEHSQCQCQIKSEPKNRKWNLKKMKSQKKNEISKKMKYEKNEISKKMKSKNFGTQSISVSDNVRVR